MRLFPTGYTATWIIALLCACSDDAVVVPDPILAVPRDPEAAFQTDSLEYTLSFEPAGYVTTIGFTFKNPTADTVFVINCRKLWQFHVEKHADGQWIRAFKPTLPGCLDAPIVIAPGSEARASLRIAAGYPGTNIYPQFEVATIAGVYRIVWNHVVDAWNEHPPSWGAEIAVEHRVSNRFVMTSTLKLGKSVGTLGRHEGASTVKAPVVYRR